MDKLFTKKRRKDRLKYYNTKTWRNIRSASLRRNPLCEKCRLDYRKISVATVVDHIKPWETWKDFVKGPFQSLCRQCHDDKTWFSDIPEMIKKEKTKITVKEI